MEFLLINHSLHITKNNPNICFDGYFARDVAVGAVCDRAHFVDFMTTEYGFLRNPVPA
jgi:hypothetical protein